MMPPTALRLCYFLLDQKVTKKSRTASGTFLLFFGDFGESRFSFKDYKLLSVCRALIFTKTVFHKEKLSCKKRRVSQSQTANCQPVLDAVREN
jgi:hypothetical protein